MPHITQAMIDALAADSAGVRHLGTITVGPDVTVGKDVTVGDYTTVGARVVLEAGVTVGHYSTLWEWAWLGQGVTVGHYTIVGPHATLEQGVTLGDYARLEAWGILEVGADVGGYTTLREGLHLLPGLSIGQGVTLGRRVVLREHTRLGEGVTLGDDVTSASLNAYLRSLYAALAPTHRFTKWVTQGRLSPHFDGPNVLHYAQGATLRVPDAVVSDAHHGPGLHVLSYGHRPEWYGLCDADHRLVPLTVEVQSDDILFAGLPTMDHQIRVRALTVLD